MHWSQDTSTGFCVFGGGSYHNIRVVHGREEALITVLYNDDESKKLNVNITAKPYFEKRPVLKNYRFKDSLDLSIVWPETSFPVLRDIVQHGLKKAEDKVAPEIAFTPPADRPKKKETSWRV